MFRALRLHPWFVPSRSRKERRRQAARQRRGVRPMLETLEDRLTPSTVTENAADAATLQSDLHSATAANTQYVINLTGASSAYNLEAGQQLTISAAGSGSSVTIAGSGQNITGNGNRVFYVDSGANVSIQDVTITGGSGVSQGGGVYISGAATVTIRDSIISGNHVQGSAGANGTATSPNGGDGGNADGGGVYASGSGWSLTLIGDTLSGNSVVGGNGGNGAAGGNGGIGGLALGGAAYFTGSGASLTILNDPSAPATHPSIMLQNSVQAGAGGKAGSGGTSGNSSSAEGGAVFLSAPGGTINIGNTTFYGNRAVVASGGGQGVGGAIDFRNGNFTMVNSTVANNSATAITTTYGGGIADNDPQTVVLDNNTITANTVSSGNNIGAGMSLDPLASNPTLLNNLITGNTGTGSADIKDVITGGQPLSNATHNFIGSVDPAADFSTTSNLIGNSQAQLGGVVGVTANGAASGGPIYYPLLANTVSLGSGTTSVLTTIAGVEGATTAHARDEIGNLRSTNGTIDLGAVQLHPVIVSSPTSQTVTAGATVTFTASAASTLTPTTVQWQFSSNGGTTFTNISGATSTTLTLKNVTTAMNGYKYQAVFTNNGVSATTSPATLNVNAAPSPPPSPPSPPSPPTPPTVYLPPLLTFFDALLGGVETVNSNGTETITDPFFGFPLLVSVFDSSGNLVSVDLFGIINVTILFQLIP